ncbi:hypothetical protein [Aquiflexum lacus]|uniref:hypothetical protein n=1 Tax=Aquiflexum lacus TaxID=2483805 RepID=UPI00189438D7|nr:hypothetical protein [Aquiflexum lacus]
MDTNYFEPDPIMSSYQILSSEEFVRTYLVKGDFGPEVPEEIRLSYEMHIGFIVKFIEVIFEKES